MEEKVYYKDDKVKITNLRITCKHVTIPLDKVDHTQVELKVNQMTAAISCLLAALAVTISLPVVIDAKTLLPLSVPLLLWVILSFVWVWKVYKSYVEFIVLVGSDKVKLMYTTGGDREYIYGIEKALNDAVFDEKIDKKLAEEKGGDEIKKFSASETMKLRQMLLEYEEQSDKPRIDVEPDKKEEDKKEEDKKK